MGPGRQHDADHPERPPRGGPVERGLPSSVQNPIIVEADDPPAWLDVGTVIDEDLDQFAPVFLVRDSGQSMVQ